MTSEQFTTIATATILDQLCEVVDAARASGELSPAWARALDTAYGWLLTTDTIEFDHLGHALRVESATEPGTFYTANGDCECKAFTQGAGVCWHRAAARLVRRALARDVELQRDAALAIADHIAEAREELLASIDETLPDFAAQWDKAAQAQRWAATERLTSEMYA